MAYKQNNPFSRKTSSPLNHGTHRNPRGGHEGHGGEEEWVTTGTQEGLTGNDIVTSGTRQYTVPGSEQAGTGVGYQESYDKLTDEQRVTYPTVGDWETYVKGYNQEQQAQTFEETRNRDVNINRVKENKPQPPKTYDFKITDPDDRYGPALDVNWEYPQIKDWAKNKYGDNWKNSPHITSWMKQNNLSWQKPGYRGRQGKNTQNITDYTYNTREIN